MDGDILDMRHAVLDRLRAVPLLREVIDSIDQEEALTHLQGQTEWFAMPGGMSLFRQGDVGRDLYVLLSGRLGVSVDQGLGPQLVSFVEPGELIGEMAVVSGEPRTATVTAFRDSELLRVSPEAGEWLLKSSRPFMSYVIRQLVGRLKTTTLRGRTDPVAQAVAVVAFGGAPLGEHVTRMMRKAFAPLFSSVSFIDEAAGADRHLDLSCSKDELVVYLAGDPSSAWSRRCLRQTDRAIFVTRTGSRPDPQSRADVAKMKSIGRPADLVLVNPTAAKRPSGATPWLELFAPERIIHVREDDLDDYRRAARLATGRGIGIVLSGGGARGFAHIGVIRALHDMRVPIDMVCGTSIGALVGASAALDVDPGEVARKVHHGFVQNNPVNDYTLPLVALARGRKMSKLIHHHFDGAVIEDMWKTYFCVSANLTSGKPHVHRSGPIWRALRASSAIPGIVPPFVEDGEVLVDGGIMNNFPADILASLARGRVIGIEVSARTPFRTDESDIESRSLLWMLGAGRGKFPNILKVLMRSGTINTDVQTDASRNSCELMIEPELSGIDMLSFDKFDLAVETGYRATVEALQRVEQPFA